MQPVRPSYALIGVVLLTVFVVSATVVADVKIEEKQVGPGFTPGVIYTLSPKGMHVATAHGRDGKAIVTVDGVDGPQVDKLFTAAVGVVVETSQDGFNVRTQKKWVGPVAFSPDGTRHAYAGQVGEEAVVYADGAEVYRAPISKRGPTIEHLHFAANGQLFFLGRTEDSFQSFRLFREGQPVTPAYEGPSVPFFSADASRWGIVATAVGTAPRRFLIIDGEEVGYVSDRVQFASDGRVVCVVGQRSKHSVLVDGNELVSAQFIDKVVVGATGDIGVIATVDANGRKKLFVNGEAVLDDATDVVFSPDGKRRAAVCALNQKASVVLDGEKHEEFWPIDRLAFTPDSSKFVYVGKKANKNYVVVNGKPDAGNNLIHYGPLYSDTGNAVAYTAGEMMGKLKVHFNEHVEPVTLRLFNLRVSPDGQRYAYYGRGDAAYTRWIVDGEEKPLPASARGGNFTFSADSSHVVGTLYRATWCDDRKLESDATPLDFTPDSRHLILQGRATTPERVPLKTYFVNGDLVAKFAARNTQWAGIGMPKAWEQQDDGSIVFVGSDVSPLGQPGVVMRVTVTPDPERTVASWLSGG